MKCPASFSQINRDLEKFPVIDLERLRKEGFKQLDITALCHYSVVKGKVEYLTIVALLILVIAEEWCSGVLVKHVDS